MKIRSVRPEFFTDTKMAELSHSARILYVGLWCYVDDEGRGEYLPKRIEGEVFPHESVEFDALWAELESSARVVRYEVEDRAYFYIPSFEKHQKPNRKYESRLPAPGALINVTGLTQRVDSAYAHSVEVEGEGEGVGVLALRARDNVWDSLALHFGEATTEGNRKLRGKVVRSLKAAGATGDEIALRIQAWPYHFPDATLTETALEKHWDRLGKPPARATTQQVEEYQANVRALQRQRQAEQMEKGIPS